MANVVPQQQAQLAALAKQILEVQLQLAQVSEFKRQLAEIRELSSIVWEARQE
jgi:hypothetical protein